MKVAFDISPLKNGHTFRGIGNYTQNLKIALSKQKTLFELDFVDSFENLNNYDLVHHPYFDLFFHTLPVRAKYKRVVTIHDVIPLIFPNHFPSGIKGNISLFLQKQALRSVSRIICDSNTSAFDISNKLSYPAEKISKVYLASGSNFKKINNEKMLEETAKKYHLPKRFCLYVGDVNWNKNVEGLIQAVAVAKLPLVLVGRAITDDQIPQTISINSAIAKLNIKNLITRTGYVPEEDLINIYNLAEVTVQPSFYEGFGLPVVESMSCGTPVVCSQNSSLAEITSEKTAFYCDPTDTTSIANKIIHAFNLSSKEKESLGKKLILAADAFSWDKVAKQTISIYQQILELK